MVKEQKKQRKVLISIRTKILGIILVVLGVSVGPITWQGMTLFIDDKENYVDALNLQVAVEQARQVQERTESIIREFTTFGDALNFNIPMGEKRKILNEIFSTYAEMAYLAIYDPARDSTAFYFNSSNLHKSGREAAAVRKSFIPEKIEGHNPEYISVAAPGADPTIKVTYSYETPDGKKLLLTAEYLQTRFLNSIEGADVYTAFLVDHNGRLIAHPDKSLVQSKIDFSGLAVVEAMWSSEMPGSRQYTDPSGEPMLGAFSRAGDTGLGVIVQIPKSEAFAATTVLLRRSLFIVAAVAIVALFVGLIFAGSLSRPVVKLAEIAKKVAGGDFDQEAPVKSHDEIGMLSDTFNTMTKGLKERDRVKQTFARYVSKQVAEKILSVDDELLLVGEKKEVSILFSDIRGFTTMSERLAAPQVVEILNEYFRRMVNIVFTNNGTLDKYIGDAIMAVYGTPIAMENKEIAAVKSAHEMILELDRMNEEFSAKGWPPLRIGIGVHTGEVVAGNIGSPERLEYTIIGDNVNTAQRIEATTKQFDGGILLGQSTYDKVKDIYDFEPLEPITVRGKSDAMIFYRLLGEKVQPPPAPPSQVDG